MTTTHTNLALVENQIHIFSQDKQTMLFSTDDFYNKIGVEKLDRKHFVKPKVDVEELADEKYNESHTVFNEYYYEEYKQGFKDGHNAKESKFTREDMEKAIFAGYGMFYDDDTHDKIFEDLIKEIRPLSLPKSVTLNENNEVISVEW